jgi:hypothetical protein
MKIFNDFDTSLKWNEYNDAIKKHWKENVLLIERYTAFWIMRGLIPAIFITVWEFFLLFFAFKFEKSIPVLFWTMFWAGVVLGLIFLYYLFNVYLDYKFDFSLVTPEWILTYKQIWLLDSKFKDLPAWKIRSIQARRDWLLWNIFWFWSIEILTDWWMAKTDAEWRTQAGRTKFSYAYRPNELRKKINNICLLKYSK